MGLTDLLMLIANLEIEQNLQNLKTFMAFLRICLEHNNYNCPCVGNLYSLDACSHRFCYPCLDAYIAKQLEERMCGEISEFFVLSINP